MDQAAPALSIFMAGNRRPISRASNTSRARLTAVEGEIPAERPELPPRFQDGDLEASLELPGRRGAARAAADRRWPFSSLAPPGSETARQASPPSRDAARRSEPAAARQAGQDPLVQAGDQAAGRGV